MSYLDRNASFNWGCLPAAAFGILFGIPAVFVTIMGECIGENAVELCSQKDGDLLLLILAMAAICLFITWASNRTIRQVREHGRLSIEGLFLILALGAVFGWALFGWFVSEAALFRMVEIIALV